MSSPLLWIALIAALLLLPSSVVLGGATPSIRPPAPIDRGTVEHVPAASIASPGASAPSIGPLSPSAGPWVLLGTAGRAPSARASESLAYDPVHNFTLAFGGDYLNDTWKEKGGTWTNISANLSTAPSRRGLAPMAYDAHDGYFVLFGGFSDAPTWSRGEYDNDTWIFNGSWKNITGSAGAPPSPRFASSMVYDPQLSAVVLFGGVVGGLNNGASGPLNDTWEFRNGTWKNVTGQLSTSPPGRDWEALAYDVADRYLVLYGGYNEATATLYSDTWTFNGSAWSKLAPSIDPGALRSAYFASSEGAEGYPLLYGGDTSPYLGAAVNATWVFRAGQWTNLTARVGSPPTPLNFGALVWDGSLDRLVLFGGYDAAGAETNSTWTYDPALVVNGSLSRSAVENGTTVRLSVSAHGGNWSYSYAYSGLPPGCTSADAPQLNCTPSATGNYTLVANVTDGVENASAAFSLEVVNLLTIALNASRGALDVGQTAVLNASIAGGLPSYTAVRFSGAPPGCSTNSSTQLICQPTVSGLYSVTAAVSDAIGDTAKSASVVLNVTGAPTIDVSVNRSTIDLGQSVRFTVVVSPALVGVNLTWTGVPAGCVPTPVTFDCSPTAVGNLTIEATATDPNGVLAQGFSSVDVRPPVAVTWTASPPDGQAPFAATFIASPSGGLSPYSVSWVFGDGGSGFGTTVSHTFATPGTYPIELWANDSLGGSARANGTVTVLAALSAQLSVTPSSRVLDANENLTLAANVTGGVGPFQYTWKNLPNGCLSVDRPTLSCRPLLAGTDAITLVVQGSIGNASATSDITVHPALAVVASAAPIAACGPSAVNFTAAVTGGTVPYTIRWDFGSGDVAMGADQERAYSSAGNRSALLSVSDLTGASVNQTVQFALIACPSASLPTGGEGTLPGYIVWGAGAGIALAAALALAVVLRRRRRESPGTTESVADEVEETDASGQYPQEDDPPV